MEVLRVKDWARWEKLWHKATHLFVCLLYATVGTDLSWGGNLLREMTF